MGPPGAPCRVPSKSRAVTLCSQLRRSEYQQASDFTTGCRYPATKISAILFSLAHDAMSPNHDQSFRDINFFLSGPGATLGKHAVRVFDTECQDGLTRINLHQFGDVEQTTSLDMSIDLLVWRGRMGFLTPSEDTGATSWRDWAYQVGEITLREWAPWAAIMGNEVEPASDLILYPCETCLELCRFAPPEIQSLGPNTVGGLQPVKGREAHQESIRRLYRLFDIYDLPLLAPPPIKNE